jgi:Fibronectin type III domain
LEAAVNRFRVAYLLVFALLASMTVALSASASHAMPAAPVAGNRSVHVRPAAGRTRRTGRSSVIGAATGLQPAPGQYFPARVRVVSGVDIAAGATSTVTVTGSGGIPATGVSGVAINVAADGTGGAGGLTLYPSDLSAAPAVTGVQYRNGVWVDQLIMLRTGANGQVKFKNGGTVPVRIYADVLGYDVSSAPATTGSTYVPLNTARILNNASVAANGTYGFAPLGQGGVPATGVTAVVFSLIAKGAAAGKVRVYPSGTTQPADVELDYQPNVFGSNLVIAPVGSDGKVVISNTGTVAAGVYADVEGYFASPAAATTGASVNLVTPSRIVASTGIAAGGTLSLAPLGKGGIPASGVTSAALDLTVTSTGSGAIRAYPSDQTSAPGDSLEFVAGGSYSQYLAVRLGADGKVVIKDPGAAAVTITVDVFGYFAAPGPPSPPPGVSATAGDSMATVGWQEPADGGSAITGYKVTASPGGTTATAAAGQLQAAVTGLTDGTRYTFTVTATNAIGTSPPSSPSDPIFPSAPKPPDPPFITNVTSRDSAVDVSWSPPDTGTAELTGYVITVTPGGTTVNEPPSATDAIVTGLTNATAYRFTVTAVDANGNSPASPNSTPVSPRPADPPSAPANLIPVPQNGQLQLAWSAPPDGGSPITGYKVTVTPGPITVSTDGGTTIATVTGLTNGTAYTASVVAINKAGTSTATTAAAVKPLASIAPGPPTNLTANATAAGQVALQWAPPFDPGTATITSYTVTAGPGAKTVASDTCSGSPLVCTATMTGLSSTTAYTFAVTATSSAGTGPASSATDAVTPNVVVKQAPVILSAASVATLKYVRVDGTLVFAQPPAQVTGLVSGNLVMVDPTPLAPMGFLGRVHAVSTQGGFVVVTTTKASLDDVFSTHDTSLDLPVNAAATHLVNAAPGVSLSVPTEHGHPLAAGRTAGPADSPIQWTNGALVIKLEKDLIEGESEEGEKTDVTSGPVAKESGTITVKPIVHAHFSGTGSLSFTIGGSVTGDVAGEFGVHLGVTKSIYLGTIPGPEVNIEVPVPDGAVPIPSKVAFPLYMVFNSDGSVGVSFDANFNQTMAAKCTVILYGSGTPGCASADQNNGGSGAPTIGSSVYGKMNITAGVQIGATLQIAFVAGPQVTLTPDLKFTADTTANPWWDLFVEGHIGVSVTTGAAFGDPTTIYEVDDILNQKLIDLDNSGGPWSGLTITPSVVQESAGQPFTFTAGTPAGQVSSASVTWKVLTSVGTIDKNGTFVSPTNGVAVIEADYNGLTARAGVVIGDVFGGLQFDRDTRGVVLGAVASWKPPTDGTAPSLYDVTAQPADGSTAGESVQAPAPATHVRLPNLTAGVSYILTLYADSPNGDQEVTTTQVVPLDPLPGILSGTSFHGDIALNPETGKPDSTGTAGLGGAALSANGVYAFYYTEGRSNLAPVSVYNPADEDLYLVRQNLATGLTDVASIGLSGSPVPVAEYVYVGGKSGTLKVAPSGNAVSFAAVLPDGTTAEYVHDMVAGTTSVVTGISNLTADVPFGLSNIGTIGYQVGNVTGVSHVYLQATGGSPKQIDTCTTNACGAYPSMSGDGNLVAYEKDAPGVAGATTNTVSIYNASTGQTSTLSQPADNIGLPVLSTDGTSMAVQFFHGDPTTAGCTVAGVAITPVPATQITTAQLVTQFGCAGPTDSDPSALSDNGKVALTTYDETATPLNYWFDVASQGSDLVVPTLGTTTTAATIDIAYDGSLVLYTLGLINSSRSWYPGVYEWRPA